MFRLKIIINAEDFIHMSGKIKAYNCHLNDKKLHLSIDRKSLAYIKTLGYEYEIVKKPHKFKTSFILGLIFFLFIAYVNNERVSAISFNAEYPINEEIRLYLERRTTYIAGLGFFNDDYLAVSRELRSMYSSYEWIMVYKEGTTLKVVINETESIEELKEENKSKNIYAKKTGIIKSFTVFSGNHELYYNQYVKKGDVLVSSDKVSRGLILASVYEDIHVRVLESSFHTMCTGKSDTYQVLSFFNHEFFFNRETAFINNESKENVKFSLGNVFAYKIIEEKEKSDIITVYSEEEAIQYGRNFIANDFMINKTNAQEELLDMALKSITLENGEYHMVFLVNKLESIGQYLGDNE